MGSTNRRTFLTICLGTVATVAAAVASWPLYRYLAPRKQDASASKVALTIADIPEGEAKFIEFAGSSAVVVHKKDGGFVALSAVCTHLGCIVQWERDKQAFLCPCHAGHYTADGIVTAGPPPKPLNKLPVSITNNTITIG